MQRGEDVEGIGVEKGRREARGEGDGLIYVEDQIRFRTAMFLEGAQEAEGGIGGERIVRFNSC